MANYGNYILTKEQIDSLVSKGLLFDDLIAAMPTLVRTIMLKLSPRSKVATLTLGHCGQKY
jgi:hypothetical protein